MNTKGRLTKDSYLNYYNQGLNDLEISKKLDMCHSHVCKFRKKLKLPSNYRKKENSIKLTSFEKEVLIGTLLGDSTIRYIHNKMKNPNLTFSHCKDQKEYFDHKVTILNKLISSYNLYKNGKGSYTESKRWIATGRATQTLIEYRDTFYKDNKIIPYDYLYEYFTDVSLAFLFMDDGCKNIKTINLNLQNFSDDCLNNFVLLMKNKFDLEFILKKDRTLYLRYSSREKFYNLVNPYVIDSMRYKLNGIESSLNFVNLGNSGDRQP